LTFQLEIQPPPPSEPEPEPTPETETETAPEEFEIIPNSLPKWMGEVEFQLQPGEKVLWSLDLFANIEDAEGDEVTISVDLMDASFLVSFLEPGLLALQNEIVTSEQVGSYQFTVLFTDEAHSEAPEKLKFTKQLFKININETTANQTDANGELTSIEEKYEEILKQGAEERSGSKEERGVTVKFNSQIGSIAKISPFGKVTIEFTKRMNFPSDFVDIIEEAKQRARREQ